MDSKIIIDGFLNHFGDFRLHCDNIAYDGVVNPVDGIFYPGVSLDIPDYVKEEVFDKIKPRRVNFIFLRLSLGGVVAPHQAHTDMTMGSKSLMLYMSRKEDCRGGTSLLRHRKTGMTSNPENEEELEVWKKDVNNPDAWEPVFAADMKTNRGFIFDASLMHRAEPIGGFGNDQRNGRLVMTMFYD